MDRCFCRIDNDLQQRNDRALLTDFAENLRCSGLPKDLIFVATDLVFVFGVSRNNDFCAEYADELRTPALVGPLEHGVIHIAVNATALRT